MAEPERRTYDVGGQVIAKVALCPRGLDDLYLVMGEARSGVASRPAWLVRAYFNPLVRLIFLGPVLMALGGAASLSDRRLRLAFGARASPKAAPA
jgi:cytochrome c-type biogenesis protein CcmF